MNTRPLTAPVPFLVSSPPTPRLVRAFRFRPVSVLTPVSPSVSLSRLSVVCRLPSCLPACLLTTITTAICCPSSFASPCPPPVRPSVCFFSPPRIAPFSGFHPCRHRHFLHVVVFNARVHVHAKPAVSSLSPSSLSLPLTSRARVPPPTRRLAHINTSHMTVRI
ncbi:hypothetical protein HETIRDRAFT_477632 [Heterobasidion irregulare TC 32-1]|uniref:Uncharacterized protein n=1 Tax=Heterobasidion irregulare (strain TC 32-1) TaxID=747525 RepID=W4K2K0_HETIT|nr:uncharacterized protein HETIRDRAFT_477632 [Heterobasidion irregulare TC 32-1]ETW80042.1 hypothetical protein HETIRDRAFT_477632 [Heterobasidion irregulare TC 32-1]